MIPSLEALGLAKPEAKAVQAVATGSATPEQQRLFFAALRQKFCIEDGVSMASTPELTAFNEGRRFVGVMVGLTARTSLSVFPEVKHG